MRHKTSMIIMRTNVQEMSCYTQFTCVAFAFPEAVRQQPVETMALSHAKTPQQQQGLEEVRPGCFMH